MMMIYIFQYILTTGIIITITILTILFGNYYRPSRKKYVSRMEVFGMWQSLAFMVGI
jgi:hypothetical protein